MMRSKLVRAFFVATLSVSSLVTVVATTSTPALAAAGSITGTVSKGTGGVFPMARVHATTLDGRTSFPATANAAGVYSLVVDPGTYCVSFSSASDDVTTVSYPGVTNCLAGATPITVASGGTVPNINATLHLGAISGKVVDQAGTAVVGADMDASQVGGSGAGRVPSTAGGLYTIPDLPPGAYCLAARGLATGLTGGLPTCQDGARRVDVAPDATTSNVDVTLAPLAGQSNPTGSISGRVSSAMNGLPLATWSIVAIELGVDGSGLGSTTSVADGTYVIAGLSPGSYCVRTGIEPEAAPGAEVYDNKDSCEAATPVVVGTGAVTGIDFVLEQGGSIAGTITKPGGLGLQYATITVTSFLPLHDARTWYVTTTSLTDGFYEIAGLAGGDYCVSVSDTFYDDYATRYVPNGVSCDDGAAPIHVTRGAVTMLDVQLDTGGTIAGTIAVPPAEYPYIRVTAVGPDGERHGPFPLDGAGKYVATALTPGSYCLIAQGYNTDYLSTVVGSSGPSCRDGSGTIAVTNGATTTVNATLALGGSVSGWVITTEGRPFPAAIASIERLDGVEVPDVGVRDTGRTDGSFRIRAIPPGDWCLFVESFDQGVASIAYRDAPSCAQGATPITIVSGVNVGSLTLTPGPIGYVQGDITVPAIVAGHLPPELRVELFVPGATTPTRTFVPSSMGGSTFDYSIEAPDGTYCVLVTPDPASGLAPRAFATAPGCGRGAQLVTVRNGEYTTGIDISLAKSVYIPLSEPRRVLDTRVGFSTVDGVDTGGGGIALRGVREVKVAGRAGVPGSAASVVLNVTAVDAGGPGFLTVWPCGVPQPLASNVNFATGQTVPNSVIARAGVDGKVCLFSSQAIEAVVDVAGYFPSVEGFTPLSEPRRVLDTRGGFSTIDGVDAGGGGIALGGMREVKVAGRAGVPASAASVVLNVTAVDAGGPGFLTVWPCGVPKPLASNVNFATGQTVPNSVIAKAGVDGKVCLFSSQAIDAVVDVAGYFPSADGFTPLPEPHRLLDTRAGFSTIDGVGAGAGRIELGGMREIEIAGRGGVPETAASVVLNVTAVDAGGPGFLTVWPCGVPQPLASNVNFASGQTVPNSVIAKAGIDGKVCIFSSQAIDAVVDVAGYFPV